MEGGGAGEKRKKRPFDGASGWFPCSDRDYATVIDFNAAGDSMAPSCAEDLRIVREAAKAEHAHMAKNDAPGYDKMQEHWSAKEGRWVHRTPLARDCVGDCYVVFCTAGLAALVREAHKERKAKPSVGPKALRAELDKKNAELEALRNENTMLNRLYRACT